MATKTKPKHRPKRKSAKAKTYHFRLTAPGSGSILDAAENAMINQAVRRAKGGTR